MPGGTARRVVERRRLPPLLVTEPEHVAVDGEDAGDDRLVEAGDRRTACHRLGLAMPGGSMATTSAASRAR